MKVSKPCRLCAEPSAYHSTLCEEHTRERKNKRWLERYHNDLEFRARVRETNNNSQRELYANDPDFRARNIASVAAAKAKRPEYYREMARKSNATYREKDRARYNALVYASIKRAKERKRLEAGL
jgi:hypothetical protein